MYVYIYIHITAPSLAKACATALTFVSSAKLPDTWSNAAGCPNPNGHKMDKVLDIGIERRS